MSKKYSLDHREYFVELGSGNWVNCYPEFGQALAKVDKWWEQSSFTFSANGFSYTVKILPTDSYKRKDTWMFVQINNGTNVQRFIEGRYIKNPSKNIHEFQYNQTYTYKLPLRTSIKREKIDQYIVQIKSVIKVEKEETSEDIKEQKEDTNKNNNERNNESDNESDDEDNNQEDEMDELIDDDDEFNFDDLEDKTDKDNKKEEGEDEDEDEDPLECCICMDDLDENDYKYKKCKSLSTGFHKDCITEWWNKGNYTCPCCKVSIVKPMGNCPTGTMQVRHFDATALKFPEGYNIGTYEIHYSLPSGTQISSDDRPGTAYTGTNRYSYLPDTKEGTLVLKRLINAWNQRFTFRIGDSVTTGHKNVVVWNGIHHKTSLHGGTYGYPDKTYLSRVSGECDDIGVEKVEEKEKEKKDESESEDES